jgi:hypothetical protein
MTCTVLIKTRQKLNQKICGWKTKIVNYTFFEKVGNVEKTIDKTQCK